MPSLGCCCNFKARVNCRRLHLSWFKLRILSFLTHRDWCFTCLLKELRQHFIQSESLTGPFATPRLWNFTCILQHLQPNGWDRVALLFARLEVFEKALDGFGEDRVWGCFTARASAVWLQSLECLVEKAGTNLDFSLKGCFDTDPQVWVRTTDKDCEALLASEKARIYLHLFRFLNVQNRVFWESR